MATLKDLLDSGMSRDEINALLSQSSMSTDGFQGQPDYTGERTLGNYPAPVAPDYRDARDLGAMSTGGGVPRQQQTMAQFMQNPQPPRNPMYDQPEPQPRQFTVSPEDGLQRLNERPGSVEQAQMNTIRNNTTGEVTNLPSSGRRSHDVYTDGPQVLKEFQNPDGTIERFVKKATTDGFGRQSTVMVRETVVPDYLNPVKLKEMEFNRKRAELAQFQAKGQGDPDIQKQLNLMRMYESIPDPKMKQAFGEKHGFANKPEKRPDTELKKEAQMEGLGDAISQAKSILEGVAPDQKSLPTGSGIGSMWDALAGQVGSTPSGATEAQRMKVLGGALTSKMPRMEGPQSDKDTQLYKEMAGLVGDDTVPIPRRLDALDQVSKLWLKYEKPKSSATNYDADKETRYQAWKKARGM